MVSARRDDGKPNGGPCWQCGYLFPPGSDTCLVCGLVVPHRGNPYPIGKVERYDWVDAQHVGNSTAKEVLRVLVGHDKPKNREPGKVFPSVARLAEVMECAESRVHRGLRYLEAHGWINIEHRHKAKGRRAPSSYTIKHPHSGIQTPDLESSKLPKQENEGVILEGEE